MRKDCLREEPVGGSPMKARRKDYQVGLKTNFDIQVLNIRLTSKVKLILYYFPRFSVLSSAFGHIFLFMKVP